LTLLDRVTRLHRDGLDLAGDPEPQQHLVGRRHAPGQRQLIHDRAAPHRDGLPAAGCRLRGGWRLRSRRTGGAGRAFRRTRQRRPSRIVERLLDGAVTLTLEPEESG
jgi:hypothetical protein